MKRDVLLRASSQEITDGLGQVAALISSAQQAQLELVGVMEERELYRDDYSLSTSDWLCQRLAFARDHAEQLVRMATALRDLPEIADTFGKGGLSFDQLTHLTRYATAETDAELSETAPAMTVAQLNRAPTRAQKRQIIEAQIAETQRSVYARTNHATGLMRIVTTMPIVDGSEVMAALRQDAERQKPADGEELDPFPARMADALHALVTQSPGGFRPRPLVVVNVDEQVLLHGADGICELDSGALIAPETAERLCCLGKIEYAVKDEHGRTVGIARATDYIPRPLRRQVRVRDGGCLVCGQQWCTEVHHLIPRRHGGWTILTNLGEFCSRHHKLFHEGGWQARFNPEGKLILIRPDGTVHDSRPPTLRPDIKERFWGGDFDTS